MEWGKLRTTSLKFDIKCPIIGRIRDFVTTEMARDSILLVGDSPVRRTYVRSLVHLEHIHDEVMERGIDLETSMLGAGF